jgi:hypothetical protein
MFTEFAAGKPSRQPFGDRAPRRGGYGGTQTAARVRRSRDRGIPRRIAAGLGVLGIGLGFAELLAPRMLARTIGLVDAVPPRAAALGPPASIVWVLRALGARAIVSGVGILTQPRPAGWLWSRLAGDALDLSLLGVSFGGLRQVNRARLAGTIATELGMTALDLVAALHFTRVRREHRDAHPLDR